MSPASTPLCPPAAARPAPLPSPAPLTRQTARQAFARLSPSLTGPTALEARTEAKRKQKVLQSSRPRSPSPSFAVPGPITVLAHQHKERFRIKQLNLKRARARRRQATYGRWLRRSAGLPGLLETLSLGKSEKDYRRRLDLLVSFASKERLELSPSSHLDNTMCEYCDLRFLDGEAAEHGEKFKAAVSALQPEWVRYQCWKTPRFLRSIRGWKRMAPGMSARQFQRQCHSPCQE